MRTNYIEANIQEDIDLKNQYKNKNLPDPTNLQGAYSKNYVVNFFNGPSLMKNTEHIDLKDRNISKARFIQVNQLPRIDLHLTAKLYVDNAIDELSLARNIPGHDFGIYNLTNIKSITLNTQAVNENQVITKAYVDQFHQENERSCRGSGTNFCDESNDLVKNNQDKDLNDDKLTNLDSVCVNREPTSDNELSNKKYVADSVGEETILRFNQTLSDFLKVSVGDDTYNFTKYDKMQPTNTTIIEAPKTGGYLLQQWDIKCNDKNNKGKIQNFIKSTKTNSIASDSGAMSLPPFGDSFMYIETSTNNHGNNVYVILERTDIVQISNITFCYTRYSVITNDSLKSLGRFRIQFF